MDATEETSAPTDAAGATETAAPTATTGSDDADAGGGAGVVCGGIEAAAVGAAVGAGDFDSADDISVDADTTCLYTNSTGFYGVTHLDRADRLVPQRRGRRSLRRRGARAARTRVDR